MSLSRPDSVPAMPSALPRGGVAVVVVLAVGLHLAGAAFVYVTLPRGGAVADGQGGLTVGLGPAGRAPGAVDPVEAEPVDTVTPEVAAPVMAADVTTESAPSTPPEVSAETVPTVRTPGPVPAPGSPQVETAVPAEPVAPVVPSSVADPAIPAAQVVAPDTSARTISDVAATDPVVATVPRGAPGVSRRPVSRPRSVEEAGQSAAVDRAGAAPPQRRTEGSVPERRAPAGQQGRSGASQGDTRGSGDDAQGGGRPGARADFAATVAARLARAKQYPRRAQRAGLEGTGTVWFRMNAAGQVTAARLTRGTGHAVLDQAIMDTLRRARLPRIPGALDRAQMEFSVPMSFTLR